MKFFELQIVSWDRTYLAEINDQDYNVGDRVVVTAEWGKEAAVVLGIVDLKKSEAGEGLLTIEEKINENDEVRLKELYVDEQEALDFCHNRARQLKIPMKLVNAHFSLDKQRLVLAFIAQGRVDFRELLKDLTKRYHNNIRLQQIGVRDEAKLNGDIGTCGFQLCCQSHLKSLGNVSTDMAQKQQVAHRGVDRLSGACGRLKCCLAFEDGQHSRLANKDTDTGTVGKTKNFIKLINQSA